MNRKLICQILNHEMMLATGCTEPAAIALTAAIAREQLDGELEHIKVRVLCAGRWTASSGLWMTPARKTLKERPILWKMDMWT